MRGPDAGVRHNSNGISCAVWSGPVLVRRHVHPTHQRHRHCDRQCQWPLLAACQAEVAAKEAHKAKAAARKAELDARRAQALTQPKISALLATVQPRAAAASPAGVARPQGKGTAALGPYEDAMPPPQLTQSGSNSEGYRTAFGLPRDDDEVDGAFAATAAYDSDVEEEEALPSGWADRPSAVKRGSPVKPAAGGTPPKKAKPSPARPAAAATPVPATAQRQSNIGSFFGRQQDPTPATVEPPPRGDGPARARSGAARQLGFAAAPGPITEEEVVDLTASPQETQAATAAAHDVIDLSASPDA